MASSSSPRNWVYDVFVSFRGKDVREKFLSHFQKELDRKLIKTFIDNEIGKGQSLEPVLKQAIRNSRIAVVVFSENYASSSWCLDELVEIVKCKEELDQVVIPIFYGVDPCHVRHQFGIFGEIFAKTCNRKSENEKNIWRKSLIEVANLCGNHPQNWANEAKMVEEIVDDVLGKILSLIPQKEFENFVGMEDHIAKMIELLHLESQEVRMVGIWGTSGIGKTSIARTLYSHLISHRFQSKIFIDKAFISNVMKKYENANPYDPNLKLHLVGSFLSEILDKKDIKIDSFDAMRQMLKHHKVLIFIDDLNHQEVLNALVGQTHWFGCGSRIIVITKDKHFLRAHGINHIYEVCLPSDELALKIFCKSAFGKYRPPEGLMDFASKIALSAGNLPLGLHVLGSYVKGREKEDLIEMLPDLLKGLNGDIDKTLRVSYDGLNSFKDKAIFRHIACIFSGESVRDIKLLLADSNLDVNLGLKNLVDKSLIYLWYDHVEMHSLLQKMGMEIVRSMSNDPGEQEFIVDAKEICALLEDNNGTSKVLGIALDNDETDELQIHESGFQKMSNLRFLKIYNEEWNQKKLTTTWDKKWHLPPKLRWLRFDGYPRKCMPSGFCPKNLVKLEMSDSKLERLWEGVQILTGLKELDLRDSIDLKAIPDLSKATNLETLILDRCSSLVDLPSSIKYLNKMESLHMSGCISLETLPSGINLQSLDILDLFDCPRLNSFPDISTNISMLNLSHTSIVECQSNISGGNIGIINETLWARAQPYSLKILLLTDIPSLVELPSSIQNFIQLEDLSIYNCINLETLPTCINFCSLTCLSIRECPRLKTFPDISTNIGHISLDGTGIEEVPWWIENFTKLEWINMSNCNNLVCVSLNIYKMKHLEYANFSDCRALTEASWNGSPIAMDEFLPNRNLQLRFVNMEPEAILQNRSIIFNSMVLSGEEVPSFFTYQSNGYSLTNIPIRPTSLSQQLIKFTACIVIGFNDLNLKFTANSNISFAICVRCRFKDRLGNIFDAIGQNQELSRTNQKLFVWNFFIPPNKCNASLAQLNYDHVDMEIHINDSEYKLERCGIRLLEECSSPMNRLTNLYKVPHVCEDNLVSDCEECVQGVGKRQRETGSQDSVEIPFKKRQDTSTDK